MIDRQSTGCNSVGQVDKCRYSHSKVQLDVKNIKRLIEDVNNKIKHTLVNPAHKCPLKATSSGCSSPALNPCTSELTGKNRPGSVNNECLYCMSHSLNYELKREKELIKEMIECKLQLQQLQQDNIKLSNSIKEERKMHHRLQDIVGKC